MAKEKSEEIGIEIETDEAEFISGNVEERSSLLDDLSIDEVNLIANELSDEIERSQEERGNKEELWKLYRDARDGMPDESKGGVYDGSSRVVTPITNILVNNVYGKLKAAFERSDAFFVYESISKTDENIESCKILTKYVKILTDSRLDLNWETVKSMVLYESESLGTAYLHTDWIIDRKKFKQKIDNQYQDVYQEFSGIKVRVIPVDDVYFRSNAKDIQSAHFFAIEDSYLEYQIRNKAAMGDFPIELADEVLGNAEQDDSEKAVADADRNEEAVSDQPVIKLYLCYYRYDADHDGYDEDLVILYHKESNTILSINYNELGERAIVPVKYMFKFGKIEGRGVPEMVRHMQAEADFHHRLRMDASKFEGVPMYVGVIGSGLKAKEKIYPGKIFMTVHGKDDLVKLEGGSSSQLSMAAENQAVMYAQKSTAMSDVAGGFADQTLKSRDSVRGSAMRLEQSTGITESIFQNTEDSMSQAGLHILYFLVRNREIVIANERTYGRMSDEDIDALEVALTQDFKSIPLRLYCTVHVANQDETLEAMKQNYMVLYQMLSAYYEKIFPVYSMVYGQQGQMLDPESKAFLLKAIVGSSDLMDKIFALYGEESSYKYLPETEKAKMLLDMWEEMQKQRDNLQGIRSNAAGSLTQGEQVTEPVANTGTSQEGVGNGFGY